MTGAGEGAAFFPRPVVPGPAPGRKWGNGQTLVLFRRRWRGRPGLGPGTPAARRARRHRARYAPSGASQAIGRTREKSAGSSRPSWMIDQTSSTPSQPRPHGPPQEPPAAWMGHPPRDLRPSRRGPLARSTAVWPRACACFANCLMAIGFIVAGLGSFGLAIAFFREHGEHGGHNIGLISDRETIALISAAATASRRGPICQAARLCSGSQR